MTDLVEFLLARIVEKEEVARVLAGRRFYVDDDGVILEPDGTWADGSDYLPNRHMGWREVMYDPARVLAECEAKRRIVEAYRELRGIRDAFQSDEARAVENDEQATRRRGAAARCRGLEIAVELLVQPDADHPDYREDWELR